MRRNAFAIRMSASCARSSVTSEGNRRSKNLMSGGRSVASRRFSASGPSRCASRTSCLSISDAGQADEGSVIQPTHTQARTRVRADVDSLSALTSTRPPSAQLGGCAGAMYSHGTLPRGYQPAVNVAATRPSTEVEPDCG